MKTLSATPDTEITSRVTTAVPFWLRKVRHGLGRLRPRNKAFYRAFHLPRSLERELLRFDHETPPDYHGRCPFRKMQAMACLIIEHKLRSSVEIGVYRGSSLVPQAMAMRYTGGRVTGIDPWSMDDWRQTQSMRSDDPPPGEQYEETVTAIDWDHLYQEVQGIISRYGLETYCHLIRGLSFNVADQVDPEIDMLHIDGNHDSDAVEQDLRNYFPKLKAGGFLVMDDINWQGVAPHYRNLKRTLPMIWETSTWAILRKA